jgi:hypothetical protein
MMITDFYNSLLIPKTIEYQIFQICVMNNKCYSDVVNVTSSGEIAISLIQSN